MGLIGSLEELGLVDVLQMIGLAQKTGLLQLQTKDGAGAIVVRDGLIWGACVRGGPTDLRSLLVGRGLVDPAAFDAAASRARREARTTTEVLAEHGGPSCGEIDVLMRKVVEAAVLEMLGWNAGEFRFDVRKPGDPPDPRTMLRAGLSAQYLLMEGARCADEGSAERSPVDEARARVPASAQGRLPQATEFASARPVIVIDADLRLLEWVKDSLGPGFERVHAFQRSELGLARIRQYLARACEPLLLLSPTMPVDRLTGIVDAVDFVRRLRIQAPRLGVIWLREQGSPRLPAGCPADGVATRPGKREIRARPAAPVSCPLGAELRELVRRVAVRNEGSEAPGPPGFVGGRGAGPG